MLPSLTDIEQGCILVLGGAKSGKSSFALQLCHALGGKKIFLATAQPLDSEMALRIERHKKERPLGWQTVEEPLEVERALERLDGPGTVILLDCLTLWLSNLILKYGDEMEPIETAMNNLTEVLKRVKGVVVVVSNEVGLGIVPDNPVARRFRDLAGSLNQRMAALSQKVVVVLAGIPTVLKH